MQCQDYSWAITLNCGPKLVYRALFSRIFFWQSQQWKNKEKKFTEMEFFYCLLYQKTVRNIEARGDNTGPRYGALVAGKLCGGHILF